MFWQMVKGAILRQGRQLLFVALTVALGISLATAMLNVMFDVGEKVNQELKAFGANITVTSKNSSILKDIYGLDDESAPKEYLKESDLGQIKTIFWTNNIVALSPHLNGHVTLYLFLFQAHGLIIRWLFPPVKFSLQESNISSPGGSWMENGLKKKKKIPFLWGKIWQLPCM